MKATINIQMMLSALVLAVIVTISDNVTGQTTMGILPVNTSAVNTTVLTEGQWESVSLQLQNQFALQLAGLGSVRQLSREHILLLMKDMPPLDLENLSEEEYKVISKKENLKYLLKCAIESIEVIDKSVISPIHIIIVNNGGKKFWEKTVPITKTVPNPEVTEHILLNDVFKPSVNNISKEIKALKY